MINNDRGIFERIKDAPSATMDITYYLGDKNVIVNVGNPENLTCDNSFMGNYTEIRLSMGDVKVLHACLTKILETKRGFKTRDSFCPDNFIDQFGKRELSELNRLIHAYNNMGEQINDRIFSYLPESWQDEGVYANLDRKRGLVFLTNDAHQVLINSRYGVLLWYGTPYRGFEGTLFDLAPLANADLSDGEGNTLKAGTGAWHKDDLNALYSYLDDDSEALQFTGADLAPLYECKNRIVNAFILSNIDAVFADFKDDHDNWHVLISDSHWHKTPLAIEFMADCLHDFDREITGEHNRERYAEFIRFELLKRS